MYLLFSPNSDAISIGLRDRDVRSNLGSSSWSARQLGRCTETCCQMGSTGSANNLVVAGDPLAPRLPLFNNCYCDIVGKMVGTRGCTSPIGSPLYAMLRDIGRRVINAGLVNE
jgi:hypothetical protein